MTIISLMANGTVDDKIALALERKEKQQEDLLTRPVEEML